MDVTLRDFCYMCIEPALQKINLWDCDSGKDLWCGMADEIPDKYAGWYVGSWDCISPSSTILTINIIEQ